MSANQQQPVIIKAADGSMHMNDHAFKTFCGLALRAMEGAIAFELVPGSDFGEDPKDCVKCVAGFKARVAMKGVT